MTSALKSWLLAAILLSVPAFASATGGLGCGIDDKNLKFDFEALYSYSDIGGLFQIRGAFESKSPKTHETLKKFELQASDLPQHWFRGEDLKLMIYRETEGDSVPHASVKLIVEATRLPDDDVGYEGRYALTIEPAVEAGESQPFTVEGKVGCSAG